MYRQSIILQGLALEPCKYRKVDVGTLLRNISTGEVCGTCKYQKLRQVVSLPQRLLI